MTWTAPASGLEVQCMAVDYADFPAVEWTVYFKNPEKQNTPILEKIQGLNVTLERGQETQKEFILHYWKGDTSASDLYQPLEQALVANASCGSRRSEDAAATGHIRTITL
jgi:alpha-galactosidase